MDFMVLSATPWSPWSKERIDATKISEVVIGQTDRKGIENMFGDPHLESLDGRRFEYTVSTRTRPKPTLGAAGLKIQKRVFVVQFDRNGVVEECFLLENGRRSQGY